MVGPVINMRDASLVRRRVITTIFMPAYLVRARVGVLEKSAEVGPVIVVIDGSDKLPVESYVFQLGNDGIP